MRIERPASRARSAASITSYGGARTFERRPAPGRRGCRGTVRSRPWSLLLGSSRVDTRAAASASRPPRDAGAVARCVDVHLFLWSTSARYGELPAIQLIRASSVRKWWGLELAFADAKGYVLDHADGKIVPSQNEFCRQALFSKEGFRRCNESVKLVRDRLRGGRRRSVVVHECHLGFDVVAAPIRLDGELVGFLFTGGSVARRARRARRQVGACRKVREFVAADGDGARGHDADGAADERRPSSSTCAI